MSNDNKSSTKFDLRNDKSIEAMKQCYKKNGERAFESYTKYVEEVKKGNIDPRTHPCIHWVDFREKNDNQRLLIYHGRKDEDINLYDIWQELLGLLLHLSIMYNFKCTLSTSLDKWKYMLVIYGQWESEEAKNVSGMGMIKIEPKQGVPKF